MQLHNVSNQCLTQATGEVVGNNIGTLVQVANPKDDGEGASSCESGLRWISPRLSHGAASCGQMVSILGGHCLNLNSSLIFAIGVEGLHLAKATTKCGFGGKGV